VELKLRTPWRDGTTHQLMSPLELMQKLAALVPRPKLHLIRFHGVLAPNTIKADPCAWVGRGSSSVCHRCTLEHCPNGGGELRIIAAILERPAIEKILTHLGLEARAPPRSPARGPMPLQDF
jgi:Putative transposase